MAQIVERTDESQPRSGSRVPNGARILIVCDDDSITERLRTVLREAGIVSETAKSITAGCKLAKSGKFEVVLWARTFDLMQWTEALQDGAFDVLVSLYDLPKVAETIKRAVWAAYLK